MFAFVFDSVGAGEWLVLLAVLLVVMGPKRLPSTARKIGAYYSKFRRAADSFKRQLMEMDTEFERAVNDASKDFEEAARPPEEPSAEGPAAAPEVPAGVEGDLPVENPATLPSEEPVAAPSEEPVADHGDQPA